MTNNNSKIENLMKSNLFISKVIYNADGAGDSLNEETVEIILKDNVDCDVDFINEEEYKDAFFDIITDMCNMGRGWYNNDGGKIELEIDFENENLTFCGCTFYNELEPLDKKNKTILPKDIDIGEGHHFKNIIEKIKREKITEVLFSFYGFYDDFSCSVDFIDQRKIDYKMDEYNLFADDDSGIMDLINGLEDGFFEDAGGEGEVKLTILEDGSVNASVKLSQNKQCQDGSSDDLSFDEVISEIKSDTSGSYMEDIMKVAKNINDFVAEKVEKKDLDILLKNTPVKGANSSIKL